MDNIESPAQRQLAVECLVLIYRILQNNKSLLIKQPIDVLEIINTAIEHYWNEWSLENSQPSRQVVDNMVESGLISPLADVPSDRSLKSNYRLAHELFYDLEPEGAKGTSYYMEKASMCILFD